jgi:hypothetical protein
MKISLMVLVIIGLSSIVLAEETITDMPSNLKASIEWVWKNRISPKSATAPIGEGSTVRKNLIFDQIWAEKGKLFYCGRWQSTQKLTLDNRKKLEQIVSIKINNWVKQLKGYDGWAYDSVEVSIVGWAVADASVIVDKQPDEIIYTTTEQDPVNKDDPKVPAKLPYAPNTCSRFEHFSDTRYTYETCPGGAVNHFDMYLWATSSWNGAVGGDWGQRMSESAWLSGSMMIDHEMGHGFGITDFYETNERPDDMNNGKVKSIMWAGNAAAITDWDKWMLRYMWTQLKADTKRFPPVQPTFAVLPDEVSKRTALNISKSYSVCYANKKVLINKLVGETHEGPVAVHVLDSKGRVVAAGVNGNESDRMMAVQVDACVNGCYLVCIRRSGAEEVHRVSILGN